MITPRNEKLYQTSRENQHLNTTRISEEIERESSGIVLLHLSSRHPSQVNRTVDELFFNTEYHISKGNLPNVPILAYLRKRDIGSAINSLRSLTSLHPDISFTAVSLSPIQVEVCSAVSLEELEKVDTSYHSERSEAEIERASFKKVLRSRCPKPRTSNTAPHTLSIPKEMKRAMKELGAKDVEKLNENLVQLIQTTLDNYWISG